MRYAIYGIVDPREPEEIRYIGFSGNMPRRLWSHIREAAKSCDNTHKLNWLRVLLAHGVQPEMVELACVIGGKREAGRVEKQVIAAFRQFGGHRLTNGTAGGDGTVEWTERMRKTRSEHSSEHWSDEAAREQQRRAMEAYWASPAGLAMRTGLVEAGRSAKAKQVYTNETREKMRVAKLGKPHARQRTPEWNAKIGAAQKGKARRPWTPEERERRMAKFASPETRAKMSASAKARAAKGQRCER